MADESVLTPLKPEWKKFTIELTSHLHVIECKEDYVDTCCDGSFKICRNILENRYPQFDMELKISYFKQNHWFCDCYVFHESPLYLGE
jgi:hypothetical protein